MLFFYIRHGDPIYDPDSLTEQGLQQADALSDRLFRANLDKIYASSSNRAILTAKPTAEALRKDIEILDWCNESYAWHDLTVRREDGRLTWCWAYKPIVEFFLSKEIRDLDRRWYDHPHFENTRFKEGFMRIEDETYSFLASLGYRYDKERNVYLADAPTDDRVALFAHQGFGLAFLSCVLGIPYPIFATHFDIGHSAMTVIDFSSDDGIVVPRVLQLSNDSHIFAAGMKTAYNNKIEF